MRFVDGALVRDQNTDFDGARGDSSFDTNAFGYSYFYTSPGFEYHPSIRVENFFDKNGLTVRHRAIKWGHNDMSEDNEKPLYCFMKAVGNDNICYSIELNLKFNGWRTGNGKFITLGYFAEIWNSQVLRCLVQVVQVIFFWFPFYWNDGKFKDFKNTLRFFWQTTRQTKWIIYGATFKSLLSQFPIDNAWKKSDGYLQWTLIAHKTPWIFRKLIRKSTLKKKIADYYAPEGASGLWVVEIHHKLLERYF